MSRGAESVPSDRVRTAKRCVKVEPLAGGARVEFDDALVLARSLRDERTVKGAFERYERERVARTGHIVTLSRRFGAVAGWSSPVMVRLREMALRATPQSVLEREVLVQIRENVGGL